MKRYALLLLFPILICCQQQPKTVQDQSVEKDSIITTPVRRTDTIAQIQNPASLAEIKNLYATVTSRLTRKTLDSTTRKYNCSNERIGTITYYTDRGKLAIIKHIYNEHDHFSATDIYYVADGNLYFAYRNAVTWEFVSGEAAEGITKDNITEQRTYIAREKAILCLEKKYEKFSNSEANPRAADVASKEVNCKSVQSLITDFNLLVAFRNKEKHDCLEN